MSASVDKKVFAQAFKTMITPKWAEASMKVINESCEIKEEKDEDIEESADNDEDDLTEDTGAEDNGEDLDDEVEKEVTAVEAVKEVIARILSAGLSDGNSEVEPIDGFGTITIIRNDDNEEDSGEDAEPKINFYVDSENEFSEEALDSLQGYIESEDFVWLGEESNNKGFSFGILKNSAPKALVDESADNDADDTIEEAKEEKPEVTADEVIEFLTAVLDEEELEAIKAKLGGSEEASEESEEASEADDE